MPSSSSTGAVTAVSMKSEVSGTANSTCSVTRLNPTATTAPQPRAASR